jgi:hypothetical protein
MNGIRNAGAPTTPVSITISENLVLDKLLITDSMINITGNDVSLTTNSISATKGTGAASPVVLYIPLIIDTGKTLTITAGSASGDADSITLTKDISGGGNLTLNGTGEVGIMTNTTFTGKCLVQGGGTLLFGTSLGNNGSTNGDIELAADGINVNTLHIRVTGTWNYNNLKVSEVGQNANRLLFSGGTLNHDNIVGAFSKIELGSVAAQLQFGDGTSAIPRITSDLYLYGGNVTFNPNTGGSVIFDAKIYGDSTEASITINNGTLVMVADSDLIADAKTDLITLIVNGASGGVQIGEDSTSEIGNLNVGILRLNDGSNLVVSKSDSIETLLESKIESANNSSTITVQSGNLVYTGSTEATVDGYSGTIAINPGAIMQIGDGTPNVSVSVKASSWLVNGTLSYNVVNPLTIIDQSFTGSGTLKLSGTSRLKFIASSPDFAGTITIDEGTTMLVGNGIPDAVVDVKATSWVVNGTLAYDISGTTAQLDAPLTGSGNVELMRISQVQLVASSSTFAGTITIGAFASMQIGDGTVDNVINVKAASIVVNGTLTYNLSGAMSQLDAPLSGSGNLGLSGASQVRFITNSPLYTGTITIDEGASMQIGDGTADKVVDVKAISWVVNGTLAYNLSGYTAQIAVPLTGSGNLELLNISQVQLVASSPSFAGTITIGAFASMQIGDGTLNAIVNVKAVAIVVNGTLTYNLSGAVSQLDAPLTGSGNVELSGASQVQFTTSSSDFAGAITIDEGANMQIGDGTVDKVVDVKAASIVVSGTLTYNLSGAMSQIDAPLIGSGNLNLLNSSKLLFVASLPTFIGTITIGTSANMQIGDGTADMVVDVKALSIVVNGTLTYNLSDTVSQLDAPLFGSGDVELSGTSRVRFITNSPLFTGSITIDEGANMQIGDGTADKVVDVKASSWIVNGTLAYDLAGYTAQIDAYLTGSGNVELLNKSQIRLVTSWPDYTGTITIGEGANMQIGDGSAETIDVKVSSWIVNGTLTYDISGYTAEVDAPLTGSGNVELLNKSQIHLVTSWPDYTGTITIDALASIQIGDGTLNAIVDVKASSWIVNGTLAYNLSGYTAQIDAPLTGSGNLILWNNSQVRFVTGSPDFAGTITIEEAANMHIGNGTVDEIVDVKAESIVVWGTLTYNLSGTMSKLDASLTGSGTLELSGASQVQFVTSSSSFTGVIAIGANVTMQIGNGTPDVYVDVKASSWLIDGTLSYNLVNPLTIIDQTFTGSGTLELSGASYVRFTTSSPDFAGTITIDEDANMQIGDGTFNMVVDIRASSWIVNGTLAYNFSGYTKQMDAALTGSGNLQLLGGTRLLFVTSLLLFTGTVTVNMGAKMQIGNGTLNQVVDVKATSMVVNGTLAYDLSGYTVQLDAPLTGSGNVELLNTSQTQLVASWPDFAGTITIGAFASMQIGNGTIDKVVDVKAVSWAVNGTLLYNLSGVISQFDASLTGSGNVELSGASQVRFITSSPDFAGTITIGASANMQIGDGTLNAIVDVKALSIVVNGTLTYNLAGTMSQIDVPLTGSGNLELSGASHVRFITSSADFAGTVTIDTGARMQIGNGSGVGVVIKAIVWVVDGTLAYNLPGFTSQIDAPFSGSGKLELMIASDVQITTTELSFTGHIEGTGAKISIIDNVSIDASTITLNTGTLEVSHSDITKTVFINSIITGTGKLTVIGPASMIINSACTCTGQLEITANTSLQIGTGGDTGSVAFSHIFATGTLSILRAAPDNDSDVGKRVTIPSNVSGTGTFLVASPSYVLHTGNTMPSTLVVQSGATLQLAGNSYNIPTTTVQTGASMLLTGSGTFQTATIAVGATFYIGDGGGGGNVTSSGNISLAGNVVVNRSSPATGTNIDVRTGTIVPTSGDVAKTCTFRNTFTGTGTITIKSQTYAVFATASSSFFGKLEIESGAYAQVGNPTFTGDSSSGGFGGTANPTLPKATIENNGTFIFHRSFSIGVPYLLTGTGDVENRTAFDLSFMQDNTYTGKTTTYGGALLFGNNGQFGGCDNSSAMINLGSAAARFAINKSGHHQMYSGPFTGPWYYTYYPGNTTDKTDETIDSSLTISNNLVDTQSDPLTISGIGDSFDDGVFAFYGGRVIVADLGKPGFENFNLRYISSGFVTGANYINITPIIEFQCSGDATARVATSGPLRVIKSGPGKLTLQPPNNVPSYLPATVNGTSYTPNADDGKGVKLLHFGGTIIEGGSLVLNSEIVRDSTVAQFKPSITASQTLVASGARLSGAGVLGSVAIEGAAILAPGNSPGFLIINGDLDFAAGAIYDWELGGYTDAVGDRGTVYDAIDVTGTVTVNPLAELHVSLLNISMNDSFWDQGRAWDIIRTPGNNTFNQSFQIRKLYVDGVERTANDNLLANSFSDSPAGDHLALAWAPISLSVPVVFIGKLLEGVNLTGAFDDAAMIPDVRTKDLVIGALDPANIDNELTPIAIVSDRDDQTSNDDLLQRLVHAANVPMPLGSNGIIDADGLFQVTVNASDIYLNLLGAYGADKNMLACYYVPPGDSAPVSYQEIRQLYVLVPNTANSTQIYRGTRIRLPVGSDVVQSGIFTSSDDSTIVYSYPASSGPFTTGLPNTDPAALPETRGRYGFVLLNKGWQLLKNLGESTTYGEQPVIEARDLRWSQIHDICRFSQWHLNKYDGYSGPDSSTATDNTHFAAVHNSTIIANRPLDVFMIEDLPLITASNQTYHGVWFEKSDRDFNDVVFGLEHVAAPPP